MTGLAKVAGLQGFAQRAARLWGAAEGLREVMGTPLSSPELAEYERDVAATSTQIDEALWQAAWQEGRTMSLEQAIDYALEAGSAGSLAGTA